MDGLVTLLNSRTDTANDPKIIELVSTSSERLIGDWAYAANTSNQGKYGTYTLALATVLGIPDMPKDLASSVAKQIIDQEIKVTYRALTLMRPAQTIPTISLMKQLAVLNPVELFNQFDFTLRIIPKMLSQQPFRQSFLEFYMEMVRRCPAPTRRELLANRKVFSGWFGKLGNEDSDELIGDTLDILREYVLKDVSVFTKTIKMGLFNDWTLKNIQRLLANPHLSDYVVERIFKFVKLLLCDWTYGVRLSGENKLALSFLKIVKPWETTSQMDLVVRLLQTMPELVVPYFENLATAYPLTPKVSMWWFSYSVLHIRVLKFEPPRSAMSPNSHVDVMSKSIIPVTITRQVIQQALQFKESSLVQFQASQIVLFSLRRLRKTVDGIFRPRMWDPNPLIDDVLASRLPDPQMFTKVPENELLRTVYLAILNEFCQLRPVVLNIQMPLDAKSVTGLKLIQAQQILEVQTYTSDQTRWWNPSKEENSLFTQLVKFSTYNVSLAEKCNTLLQHLVQPTQLFANIPTLAHPVNALLFTITTNYQRYHSDLVWDILEQTIQRAVRSPYQAIDKVNSDRVSPFLVTLIEQYTQHFAKTDSKESAVKKWVLSFARSLIVLGEDSQVIHDLIYGIKNENSTKSQKSDEYFDFVLDESDDTILKRQDIVLKISNNLELAATLYRAATTASERVRNHLLASIPADMLSIVAEQVAAFGPFVAGSRDLCKAFLMILDGRSSTALSKALEDSPNNWDLAMGLLSTEFLMSKLSTSLDQDSDDSSNMCQAIVVELTNRKYHIQLELIPRLLDVAGIADNLLLWEPYSMGRQLGRELLNLVTSNVGLAAALVRISGVYVSSHPLAFEPRVLVAAAKYARAQVDVAKALHVAEKSLRTPSLARVGLGIVAEFKEILQKYTDDKMEVDDDDDDGNDEKVLLVKSIWDAVAGIVESGKRDLSHSVLLPDFISLVDLNPPFLARWLKVMVHQLTRSCAERKVNSGMLEFLRVFNSDANNTLFGLIWRNVHPNEINALVEAALRLEPLPETYEFVSRLALSEPKKPSKLASLSHLSTLFENTKPRACPVFVALAIFALFRANVATNATLEVEQGVLNRYDGSISAKDRILLQVLEEIETERQLSWVDNVESWDVRPALSNLQNEIDDYGQEALISLKDGDSVFVTLDEQRIKLTIESYEQTMPWKIPTDAKAYSEICTTIDAYCETLPDSAAQHYDSLFLLGCVVSCDYLFDNMEIMLNSGLLSFVISCLSTPELEETALKVLTKIFNRLPETQFKDQVGARLLIGKLLMLGAELKEAQQPFPSHIPGIVGQLALILTRPTHFLHEKVCSWLLSAPKLRSFEVPLFKTIMDSQSDLKHRELLWLVDALRSAAVDKSAVSTFVRAGVIEWCLSQFTLVNPRSKSLKDAVHKLVNRIEEVRGGSPTLMTGAGVLAVPELKQRLFYSTDPKEVVRWTN